MSPRRRSLVLVAAVTCGLLAPSAPAAAGEDHPAGRGLIVFTAETATGAQLWTVRPDGTHARQITHVDGAAVHPDWSPDGRRLVFEWDLPDDAGARIAVVDADGGGLRVLPVTQPGCVDANPAFTADGRRVVYEHFDCVADDALFVRAADGSGAPTRITPPGPDGYTEPNPSPDGRLLSYVRFADGVEFQQALTVSALDGSAPRDLLPPSEDVAVKTGWSPDGSHIVVTTGANQVGDAPLDAELAIVAVDSGEVTRPAHPWGGSLSAFAGSYSPDGDWIVLRLENGVTGQSALWRVRPDGTHLTLVYSHVGVRPRYVDWGGAPAEG